MSQDQLGLLAHAARLHSELDGRDGIFFPDELLSRSDEPEVGKIMGDERRTFETRTLTYHSQINELERAKRIASLEIKNASAKGDILDRHILTLRNAQEIIVGLAAKGQALAIDRLNLAQRIADYEMQRADTELASARSAEDVSRAEQGLLDARDQHHQEIISDLSETETHIADLTNKETASAESNVAPCAMPN